MHSVMSVDLIASFLMDSVRHAPSTQRPRRRRRRRPRVSVVLGLVVLRKAWTALRARLEHSKVQLAAARAMHARVVISAMQLRPERALNRVLVVQLTHTNKTMYSATDVL